MAEEKLTGELQLVVFSLGSEEFGVDITRVKEIIKVPEITKIPNSPPFIEGIINLRGQITPVMDLRKKLGIGQGEISDASRIIIIDLPVGNVGVIVDSVSEVLRMNGKDVDPAPTLSSEVSSDYIKGVGKLENRLLILLDLSKIIDTSQLEGMKL